MWKSKSYPTYRKTREHLQALNIHPPKLITMWQILIKVLKLKKKKQINYIKEFVQSQK